MADFAYPPFTPAEVPAPLSPTVDFNPPMVGTASPFLHVDGQNRDLILEAIRAWAAGELLPWSSAWNVYFANWVVENADWQNGFGEAVEQFVNDALETQNLDFAQIIADLIAQFQSVIAGVTGNVYSIYGFVNSGETFKIDGTGASDTANNSAIIQRAVNALNTRYIATGRWGKIWFPNGDIYCAKGGTDGDPTNPLNWCVQWKTGAGIATDGSGGTRFYPAADCTMFEASGVRGNIEHVYCDLHTIDGKLQTRATYTSKLKGWFVQGLTHSRGLCIVLNTGATGWGNDYLRDTVWTVWGDNCGRLGREKGIDPLTTSGGSTVGIGTGRWQIEDFDVTVYSRNAWFHAAFTESQNGEPYQFTKGGRLRVVSINDFVSFRDCGSDGLVSDVISVGATYAAVLHTGTILAPNAGIRGDCTVHARDGKKGLFLGRTATAGSYTFRGQIFGMADQGVYSSSNDVTYKRIAFLFDVIAGCRLDGMRFQTNSTDCVIHGTRFWDNGGNDIYLSKVERTAADLEVTDCDFRGGGLFRGQTLTNPAISRNRGNDNAPAIGTTTDAQFRGSSYVVGGVDSTLALSWVNRLLARGGWGVTSNLGVVGSTSAEAVLDMLTTRNTSQATIPATGICVVEALINDIQLWGSDAKGREASKNAVRTMVELARAGSRVKSTDASFAYTGAWTTVSNNKLSGTPTNNGRQATALGAYVDITVPGDAATILVQGKDMAGGGTNGATVAVKNGATTLFTKDLEGSYKAFAPSGSGSAAYYGATIYQGPVPLRVTGLGAGSHTIRVEITVAGALTVDCVLIPSATPHGVVLVKDPPRIDGVAGKGWATSTATGASNAELAVHNGYLDVIAAEYPNGQVTVADAYTGFDTATMLTADAKHPNDAGMAYIAGKAGPAIQALQTIDRWLPES